MLENKQNTHIYVEKINKTLYENICILKKKKYAYL